MPSEQQPQVELNVRGNKVNAHVIATGRTKRENVMEWIEKSDVWVEKATGGQSAQLPLDAAALMMMAQGQAETPPLPLEKLTLFYRTSAIHRACVETKVADIAGQGYNVVPRAQLYPRLADMKVMDDPNEANQEKVFDFLQLPLPDGRTFNEVLKSMWRSVEVVGQGFIEFSRSGSGAKNINGIYPVKGETMYIASGGPSKGFWQTRGGRWQYFAPWTGEKTVRIAEVVGKTEDGVLYPDALTVKATNKYSASVPKGAFVGLADGRSSVARVNEMIMFVKETPKDTDYGEPDVVSAMEDFLIAESVRTFAASFFRNCAVPRIAILVKGETELTQETVRKIEDFLSERTQIDVMNSALIIEVLGDTEIRIEPLTAAHLTDSTSMIDLRESSEQFIAAAHRTPYSAIPMVSGRANRAEGREVNERYVSSVVRPAQRDIEERLDYVFVKELGVKDWVIDLRVPDLLDELTKNQIWEIGIRQGYLSINDVRAAQNKPPEKGGETPILRTPGQAPGAAPLELIADLAAALAGGAKIGDLANSGALENEQGKSRPVLDSETPIGYMTGKAGRPVAFALPVAEYVEHLTKEERLELVKVVEELATNWGDAEDAVGVEAGT